MNQTQDNSGRPLINPVRGPRDPEIGDITVLVSAEPDLKRITTALELPTHRWRPIIMSRLYTETMAGGRVAAAGPSVGAPHTVAVLEQLIAFGARRIIYFGWCGSLSPELPVGTVFLPDSALVDEGTSRHYGLEGEGGKPALSKVSPGLYKELSGAFEKSGLETRAGCVWTTDAFFRETPEKVAFFSGLGAVAVEMEMSALFTVAAFRGVEMAGVLVVSDELYTGHWIPGFTSRPFQEGRRRAMEALCRMIRARS